MTRRENDIFKLIRSHGYELIRERKHFVFKHSQTGHTLVCSRTASDHRALKNIERDLKKLANYGKDKMN